MPRSRKNLFEATIHVIVVNNSGREYAAANGLLIADATCYDLVNEASSRHAFASLSQLNHPLGEECHECWSELLKGPVRDTRWVISEHLTSKNITVH